MDGNGSPQVSKPLIGGARGVLASFTGISPPCPPSFNESSSSNEKISENGTEGGGGKKRKGHDVSEENPSTLVQETDVEGVVMTYNVSEKTRLALNLPKMPAKSKSAYLCFTNDNMEKAKEENKNISSQQLFSILGEKWTNILPEEKLKYTEMAATTKEEYEKELMLYLNVLVENFDLIRQYEFENNHIKLLMDDGSLIKKSNNKKYNKKKKVRTSSLTCLIKCTVCGENCINNEYRDHPILNVPICHTCHAIYDSGEFIVSEEDNHEIYCRWCGDGGDLIPCEKCPKSFCCECLDRNLGKEEVSSIQEQTSWICLICSNHPKISEIRAQHDINVSKLMKSSPPPPLSTTSKRSSNKKKTSLESESESTVIDGKTNMTAASLTEVASNYPTPSSMKCEFINHVVSDDISLGRERNIKVKCINEIDNETLPPFTYIASNIQSKSLIEKLKLSSYNPDYLVSCDCPEGCDVNPEKCACIQMSSGLDLKKNLNDQETFQATPSYNINTKRLMEPRTAVYECNAACKCNHSTCSNRLVGLGPSLPLEVFRCLPLEKGWGVRCTEQDIPAGTFVACYQGELLDETAVEHRGKDKGDEYLFNLDLFALDCVDNGIKNAACDQTSSSLVSSADMKAKGDDEIRNAVMDEVEKSGYLVGIDAKWWGNIGRFFNHSCAPNMEKQPVFVNSHDVRIPSVAFFTNSFVPKGTELVYNYGYVKGSVEGKQMVCRCGEQGCIERMY